MAKSRIQEMRAAAVQADPDNAEGPGRSWLAPSKRWMALAKAFAQA